MMTVIVAAAGLSQPADAQGPAWVTEVFVSRDFGKYPYDTDRFYNDGRGYRGWNVLSEADVPADLRNRSFSAITRLAVEVDATGRVTSCTVVRPAEPRLDAIACSKMLAKARFAPLLVGPGKPVVQAFGLTISWQTLSRAEVAARPAPTMAPAPTPIIVRTAWPRYEWQAGVRVDAFPDLETIRRAIPGKPGTGKTTVELVFPASGPARCDIAVSSGSAALDKAACDTALALPISYLKPCDDCGERRLPLQFVWEKGRSYVHVPVPARRWSGAGYYDEDSIIPRDPRDRGPVSRFYPNGGTITGLLLVQDFADIEGAVSLTGGSFWVTIDREGSVIDCSVDVSSGNGRFDSRFCAKVREKLRFNPMADIFGDPTRTRFRYAFRPVDLFDPTKRRGTKQ